MSIFLEIPKELNRAIESGVANVDLRNYQFCAVVKTSETLGKAKVGLASSDGANIWGILLNNPNVGELAQISIATNDSRWRAATTFNTNVELMVEANTGRAKTATAGNYVGAVSKQASAGLDHQVAVELKTYKI